METYISSRMAQYQLFHYLTLTFLFKVKCVFFNVLVLRISEKRYEREQTIVLSTDRKLSICHRFAQLRLLNIMTFIYISRSRIFEMFLDIWTDLTNSCRYLQNSNGSSIRCVGITQVYLFPQKNQASFAHFLGGGGRSFSHFFAICSINWRFFWRIMTKVIGLHKKCSSWWMSPQLGLNFPGKKCVTWNNGEYMRHHWTHTKTLSL